MKDDHKTKKQLIDELSELRSQNAELKKSESPEKYRSLVENIRDVIYELDDQGVVLYISPAVRDLLGYDSAEITGKNFIGLAHKDDQSSLTEWFSELRKGKESPFEYRIIDKSGEYKWAQTRVRPIMEGGQFKGARGILIDVTTQKRAEAALRESEDRYRELNDVLPISISTFEVDAAGTIISYNRTALETFRYNEDDYKEGMNALQFFAPEEWQRVGENMRGVTQGTSTPGQEFTFLRKDGSKFPGLIYASPNIHQDKTVGIRGVIMDITERKRTDAKLRQQADAMDAATDGIALLNAEGEYVYVNNAHAKCYGYENAGELIGKSWRVLYDSDVLQRFDQEIMPEFSRKGDWHGEAVGTKKNGAKFPQELSLTAMNNGGLICVVRDITERKRAEEQIYRANAFLDSIVENIPNMLFLKEAGSLRFVRFNRAGEDLLGYSRNDLLGKNDYDFFPKEQADHFTKKDREVLHGKEVVDIPEELLQTRNKGERTMHTKKVPLLDMNGEPEYLLGISEDITERKQAEKQLQDTLESLRKAVGTTIQVISSTVEARDPYTSGHQIRSADLARAIAMEMELPQDKIEGLRMAGSIHDIGKISIPAEILSKPTKLSELEFSLIKEHANKGFEMLKDVESPWPLAEIVRQHHERMDGSGYPRNLKGEEILMEARILSVADVVEAMASHRPYRPGLGIEAALNEIEKNRGIFYDEAVVDACLKLFREKGFQLEGT